jgi:hypothetical protein
MKKENSEKDTSTVDNVDASYVSMIRDANQILDMLSKVWKYCLTALLLSLSIVSLVSIGLFVADPTKEQFFTEGIIFLAIAVWIFARNLLIGRRNRCCTEEIPHWKSVLASFIKPDNSFNAQKDGESVIENLMKVILATSDWIRTIKRDVFSVLFWPIVAIVIFLLSVYQVNVVEVRIIEVAFIVYMFTLAIAIYYGVNLRFRRWQVKVDKFRAFTSTAIETL